MILLFAIFIVKVDQSSVYYLDNNLAKIVEITQGNDMRTYKPDLWLLLKITGPNSEPIFKILGSWYGGFGGSNSWRLSSGCLTPEIDGDSIVWPQSSGSTYEVSLKNIGASSYTQNVLASYIDEAEKANISLEVVEFSDFKE